jgi:hypothetical protein
VEIDNGEYHMADAKNWEQACRHIGLFLWWAAERGLAAEAHHPAVLRCGATAHVLLQCETKLVADDLNEQGNVFAAAEYDNYLGEVHAYAGTLGINDYDLVEDDTTKAHFFAWLDARREAGLAAAGN